MWYLLFWLLFWLATISILSVSNLFADLIVLLSSNLENPFEVVTGSMCHACYLIWTDMLTTIVAASTETVEYLFLYCNEVQNCCVCYGAVFLVLWQSTLEASIIFKIFWDFLTFYQIFLPAQVKGCSIITYEHGIYELPNDLRPRILEN